MNKIAADVVLLPCRADMQRIISSITYDAGSPIVLNPESCLPHMSLAMGVLELENLAQAQLVLKKVAPVAPESHTITKFTVHETPNGRKFKDLTIHTSAALVELHKEVLESFASVFDQEAVASLDMFVSPPSVAEATLYWVNTYYEKNPKNFRPHITLGEGEFVPGSQPFPIVFDRIAICQLGSYCTARKVLAEVSLGS